MTKQQGAQIKLRVPEDLRDWLKIQAITNRRTLNNEVAYRLENSRQSQQQGAAQ